MNAHPNPNVTTKVSEDSRLSPIMGERADGGERVNSLSTVDKQAVSLNHMQAAARVQALSMKFNVKHQNLLNKS